MERVAVVGGGIAGTSAALRLAQAGRQVVLVESSPQLGGLVVSFSVGGTPLECFYHHVFPHESHIRGLIAELGLQDRLAWLPSRMGVLSEGRIWPFTTPLDVLRFGPLTLPQRVRMGVGGLALQRWKDWQPLDEVPAEQWLRRATGDAAVRALWSPLLRAKFGSAAPQVPAAWMWGRLTQRSGARSTRGERLGYLRGGFKQLFDALAQRLTQLGVDLRLGVRASRIEVDSGRVAGLSTSDGPVDADVVVYAGTLPGITRLVDGEHAEPSWLDAMGLGVVCAVVETDSPITDAYWTNVCDDRLGFGGIIEHTNLVPAGDYGGRHVTYLGRYFTEGEPTASADPAALAQQWLTELRGALPQFDRRTVLDVHAFRVPYAAPLVTLGYRRRIPGMRASRVEGLYLATTAQIYPQDRGMSEGVRLGAEVAGAVLADSSASAS